MYRHLNIAYIITTAETLSARIRERFPQANLSRIAKELVDLSREARDRVGRLARPFWLVRLGMLLVLVAAVALVALVVRSLDVSMRVEHIADLLQGLDAATNELIVLALALAFLFTLEGRLKRRSALRALHELRSIAHVIDMHQLTKDPDVVLRHAAPTESSPQRTLTAQQLSRYLDYCSEMLSLVSKLAAIHIQHLRDPVVLDAVNDVETLADGLSRKIWQKLQMLEMTKQEGPRTDQGRESSDEGTVNFE